MSKGARIGVAAAVRAAIAGLIAAVGFIGGAGVLPAVVEAAQPPAADGAFTAEQAAAGWTVYARQCGECHGEGLDGAEAPALRGVDFLNGWAGQTTDELFAYVRDEMPPGLGGSLSSQVYLDLVAYILDANGAQPGDAPLTADAAIAIGDAANVDEARRAAEAGEAPRRRPTRFVNREVPRDLTPVTDTLLADPPPGDWLSWRRTRNSHGYSPLDRITRDNVDELQLAWVLAIREGNNQTTPLVHERVMFLASPGNVVQAIDAVTGDVIWQYRWPLPDDAPQRAATRTLALYGDKVYLATHDAALVALDARTGAEAWRAVKADYTQGFRQNSGPVVAEGVVVSGMNGCNRYKEQTCFITGHDPDTGEELWRTSTIALPGRPERRVVGRHAAVPARGRRLVDPGQLRPGPRSLLHRHRPGQAVGGGEPRHDHAAGRALHQLDAGPEPADRAGRVVLPARAGRDPRPRHRVRAGARRRRRRAVALHDRQGRHPLEARPADRRVSSTCGRPSIRTSSSRSTGPPAS